MTDCISLKWNKRTALLLCSAIPTLLLSTRQGLAQSVATPAATAATAPGSVISNQAQVTTTDNGKTNAVASNIVRITVAERLDVTLTFNGLADFVSADQVQIPVLLGNAGNGTEAFTLSAEVGDGKTHSVRYVVDRDGDGHAGDGDEALADLRSPPLPPGERLPLVAIVDGITRDDTITLAAAAVTGSGTPGTTFDGQGDGGGDAVVGPTGARAQLVLEPLLASRTTTLTKTQAVRDRRGGSVAEPGAVVTYTLVARFAAAVGTATISDPAPAGTTLVAGSMTLDGAPLTDADDGDAGTADAASIRVALGAVPADATRTVTFQATIQ